MTSSRLPGKVLLPAGGSPLLRVLIERLKRATEVSEIVLATTINKTDDPVAQLGMSAGVKVFRGSEADVLGRVCGALKFAEADVCVEITGDCPLIDPGIVDEGVREFQASWPRHHYVSNSDPFRSVPAGLDVQVFAAASLYKLEASTVDPGDREHVSLGFYRPENAERWRPRFITHASCVGAEDLLLTLDYPADYVLLKKLHESLSESDAHYTAVDIVRWIRAHPKEQADCAAVRMGV